ncbi:MAG: hypothetical protein AB7F89_04080 [Pirellulaceae bacterium]
MGKSHASPLDQGPPLELLLHRLANCPGDFLQPTAPESASGIAVVAIACDLLREADPWQVPEDRARDCRDLGEFPPDRQQLIAVVCHLLHDAWFFARPQLGPAMWSVLLAPELGRLVKLVRADRIVQDPDRREELARLCLRLMRLRPQGESEAQANDRFTTLDSVERTRIVKATAAAERRAREIREAMARDAARDAASRYGE